MKKPKHLKTIQIALYSYKVQSNYCYAMAYHVNIKLIKTLLCIVEKTKLRNLRLSKKLFIGSFYLKFPL
jgi:hypothetical protein